MLTHPINSQHYAKLKKESGTFNEGTDETNGADDAAAGAANNRSDADSNSDPALASNIKPLQKQAPKRKRAPKDPSKAPPAKRGKKNTAAATDAEADADAEPESPKPRARGRARRGAIATATKTKTIDDEDMINSNNDSGIDAKGQGGAIKEEEEDTDAPAPVPVKETKPRATTATRAKKAAPNPKPRTTRAKKIILARDSEDEPDAEVAEEELPEHGMLGAYSSRSRSRTVVGGFRGGERKAAYEKEKMGEMEEEQEAEVLENINVGFEDGGEDGVDDEV